MSWEFKSPHPHNPIMILLSINNSSEIVAKKAGKFIESLTPAGFDEAKVEEEVMKQLVQIWQRKASTVRLLLCAVSICRRRNSASKTR